MGSALVELSMGGPGTHLPTCSFDNGTLLLTASSGGAVEIDGTDAVGG